MISELLPVSLKRYLASRSTQHHSSGRSVTLRYRRIYILPTWHGVRYIGVVVLLLVASINYENNLGLIFSFSLLAIALISILHTFRNMAGIKLEVDKIEPAFVDQDIYFKLRVKAEDSRIRETVRIRWQDQNRVSLTIHSGKEVIVDVPIPARKRGQFFPGKFRVYTQFPFGLFNAWSWVDFETSCLIYPKPIKGHVLSLSASETEYGKSQFIEGQEDFAGLRSYHPGDSLKHIAWKALAREAGVLTKQFYSPSSETFWLEWDKLAHLNTESRLSILCRAILDAESRSDQYGLKIPGTQIKPAHGERHKHQCLKALALFEDV